jgi:hypothetical protein
MSELVLVCGVRRLWAREVPLPLLLATWTGTGTVVSQAASALCGSANTSEPESYFEHSADVPLQFRCAFPCNSAAWLQ